MITIEGGGKGDSVLFMNGTKFRTAEFGSISSYNHKIYNSQGILKIEVIVGVVGISFKSCKPQACTASREGKAQAHLLPQPGNARHAQLPC
jgi:hypothetical protein